MCVTMSVDMCVNMSVDMCVDTCADMCIDMCMACGTDVLPVAFRFAPDMGDERCRPDEVRLSVHACVALCMLI